MIDGRTLSMDELMRYRALKEVGQRHVPHLAQAENAGYQELVARGIVRVVDGPFGKVYRPTFDPSDLRAQAEQ